MKILQTLLPLLTNFEIGVHGEVIGEALVICFKLQESKAPLVSNTATATLRQVVIYMFDKVVKEDSLGKEALRADDQPGFKARYCSIIPGIDGLNMFALDAYLVLQDLCLLTNGETPVFLRLESLDRAFGLELIESILLNHNLLLRKHSEFVSLLKNRHSPMLIRSMSEKSDFQFVVRLMRVSLMFIKKYIDIMSLEAEMIISMFQEILLSENGPEWRKTLVLEVLKDLSGDFRFLKTLFLVYDGHDQKEQSSFEGNGGTHNNMLSDILKILGTTSNRFIDLKRGSSTIAHSKGDLISFESSDKKISYLEMLDKVDPPSIPGVHNSYVALQCFMSISDGISNVAFPSRLECRPINRSATGKTRKSSDAEKLLAPTSVSEPVVKAGYLASIAIPTALDKDSILLGRILDASKELLTMSIMFFLQSKISWDLFNELLCTFQNLVIATGSYGMNDARDAMIFELCDLVFGTLGERSSDSMNKKGALVLRALLNIFGTLRQVIGFRSWIAFWKTIWYSDLSLGKGQILRLDVLEGPKFSSETNNLSSIQVIITEIRKFIMETSIWEQEAFLRMLTSLLVVSQSATLGDTTDEILRLNQGLIEIQDAIEHDPLIDWPKTIKSTYATDYNTSLPVDKSESSGSQEGRVAQRSRLNFNTSIENQVFVLFSYSKNDRKSMALERIKEILHLNIDRFIESIDKTQNHSLNKLWDLIVEHLIQICRDEAALYLVKTQAAEILCFAVYKIADKISTLDEIYEGKNGVSEKLQLMIFDPLHRLTDDQKAQAVNLNETLEESGQAQSSIPNRAIQQFDIFRIALECLKKVLELLGENFTPYGYDMVLEIIRNLAFEKFPDKIALFIIRLTFPALQLIATVFLQSLSTDNLGKFIFILGYFSGQTQDLNISLTSIGLLWTICEPLKEVRKDEKTRESEIDHLEKLILQQLAALFDDKRPDVRNTAIQTFFRAIGMTFGPFWVGSRWSVVFNEILFPSIMKFKRKAIQEKKRNLNLKIVTIFGKLEGYNPIETEIATNSSQEYLDQDQNVHKNSKMIATKQWDDASKLIIDGLQNVLTDSFETLIKYSFLWKGKDCMWQKTLDFLFYQLSGVYEESGYLVLGRHDFNVSLCVINAISQIIQSISTNEFKEEPENLQFIWRNIFTWFNRCINILKLRKAALIQKLHWISLDSGSIKMKNNPAYMFCGVQLGHDIIYKLVLTMRDFWRCMEPAVGVNSRYLSMEDPKSDLDVTMDSIKFLLTIHNLHVNNLEENNSTVLIELYNENFSNISPKSYEAPQPSDSEFIIAIQLKSMELIFGTLLVESAVDNSDVKIQKAFQKKRANEYTGGLVSIICQKVPQMYFVLLRHMADIYSFAFNEAQNLSKLHSKDGHHGENEASCISNSNLHSLIRSFETPKTRSQTHVPKVADDHAVACIEKPSFIALTKLLLTVFSTFIFDQGSKFLPRSENGKQYANEAYECLLESLLIPIGLKYQCVAGTENRLANSRALWNQSLRTFLKVWFKIFHEHCEIFPLKIPAPNKHNNFSRFWDIGIRCFDQVANSSSLPPVEIDLESLKEDENLEIEIVCSLLDHFMHFSLHNEAASKAFIADKFPQQIADSLKAASRIWWEPSNDTSADALNYIPKKDLLVSNIEREDEAADTKYANEDNENPKFKIVPVLQERLSRRCFELLCQLCSDYPQHINSLKETGAIALNTILLLTRETMELWIEDKKCYGNLPFSRIRVQEMQFLLFNLYKMNITPQVAHVYQKMSGTGTSIAAKNPSITHIYSLYDELCSLIPYSGNFDPLESVNEQSLASLVVLCLKRLSGTFLDYATPAQQI